MSILIKGMRMPKSCYECALETDYGTCGYYSYYVEAGHDSEINKRRDDCPLIEIPPHGRLIDADALLENGWYLARINYHEGKYESALLTIAPTIIEAEEAE